MPESKPNKVATLKDGGGPAAACKMALAVTYKALKAFSFYPQGHPLRERILLAAYQAMANVAKDGEVSLLVHRKGFSYADQRGAVEATPMTIALAQELFTREIQRLVVLPELSQADYNGFLSLLALDPPKVAAAGGLAALLKEHGIQTIVLNEIDITAVFTRIKAEQAAEEEVARAAEMEEGPGQDAVAAPLTENLIDHLTQMSIEELIVVMSLEKDDSQYRQLARLLLAKGLPLKLERDFDRLFTVLASLLHQEADPSRSAASREQAQLAVQQLGQGELTEHLLDHLEEAEFGKKDPVFQMLKTLGAEAVDPTIRRLIAVGFKAPRKTLTTALLRIGPIAEPALFRLLQDGRWQVVLAAVAILAELGSSDAVKGLVLTATAHSDNRVRMESIRALAGIGGMEASMALIELVRDPNQAIGIHAITWLGNSRNQRALPVLLQLAQKRDLLGKSHPLKREALLAIGRIGDRRALEPLLRLVQRRHWIAPRRWQELKALAIEAIGNLGGEAASAFLEGVSARGGHLGGVASAALEALAKRNPDHHE
jgi:HEAT repeat protein